MLSGANKARKRGRFKPIRRRVAIDIPSEPEIPPLVDCDAPPGAGNATATYMYTMAGGGTTELPIPEFVPNVIGAKKEMAELLWSGDYKALFRIEQAALEEEAGLMTGAQALKDLCKKSSYAQRGKGTDKTELENERAMAMAAAAMRQANQQKHSFS
eukprot:2052476-Prymnesium_polylepis.1